MSHPEQGPGVGTPRLYSLEIAGHPIPNVMGEELYRKAKGKIAEILGIKPEKMRDEKIFIESEENGGLGADSLDMVEIVMAIEELYEEEGVGIKLPIPDEEAELIGRVGHIRDHFNVRMAAEENPQILELWKRQRKEEIAAYQAQQQS